MLKQEVKEKIIREYLEGGTTYEALGKQYGVSAMAIWKWVKAVQPLSPQKPRKRKRQKQSIKRPPLSTEVIALQDQLRKAQLHNKLLNAMLDIGKEQYGVDLRKKPGTKQS